MDRILAIAIAILICKLVTNPRSLVHPAPKWKVWRDD